MESWYLAAGVAAMAFGGFGAWIAAQKRRSTAEGFVLGLLFGPVGAIVEAVLPVGDKVPTAGTDSKAPMKIAFLVAVVVGSIALAWLLK